MSRRWLAAVWLTIGVMAAGVSARQSAQSGGDKVQAQGGRAGSGWTIPPDAADRKNPLTVDDKVIAAGKAVFKDKCQRCHGPAGRGDGPDADPDNQEDMDLTNPKRADRNPDGVIFYKVTNGRKKPKMPAFKDELSEKQIWSVICYVQTLRKK